MKLLSRAAAMPLLLGLIAALLGGCGGGGGGRTSPAQTGRLEFAVQWPQRSRLIPAASNSIQITLSQNNAVIASQTVTRPPSGAGLTTAAFPDVPVGSTVVTANAYPTPNATGAAQATATKTVTVKSGANDPLSLTMGTTITQIVVTPASPTLSTSGTTTAQLTATALDKNGAIVLTAPNQFTWNSSDTTAAGVDQTGLVTAANPGVTTVTATNSEATTVSGSTDIFVVPFTANGVRYLTQANNDLVFVPGANNSRANDRIYASVGANGAGNTRNSISEIVPFSGTISSSVAANGEPGKLAVSSDAAYVYYGYIGQGGGGPGGGGPGGGGPGGNPGAGFVGRFDVGAQATLVTVSLGNDPNLNNASFFADDIEVAPGAPTRFAVARKYNAGTPRHAGVALFQGAQALGATSPGVGPNVLQFADATNLYGYDTETAAHGFYRMAVTGGGIRFQDSPTATTGLVNAAGAIIRYDTGTRLIYASTGEVVNPTVPAQQSGFAGVPANALVLPDSADGYVFFLDASTSLAPADRLLLVYNATNQQLVVSKVIPNVVGTPSSLIRWGTNKLAFRTDTQVVLIDSPLTP